MENKKLKAKATKKRRKPAQKLVVCVRNDGYEVSLDIGEVYVMLPDLKAARYGSIRVIDNEDEDYLYPAEYFLPVRLSRPARRAVSAA